MSGANEQVRRAERQAQASDPTASAWVSANAGSGKTYVLVTRLVTLMLQGTPPERLLCLTYTRAAAAEMQERLFQLLGEWAVLPDAELRTAMQKRIGDPPSEKQLEEVRLLFARALETPGGLKVQTIHAFCESLLNRFPLEAGVPPGFGVLDERLLKELTTQARHRLFEQENNNQLKKSLNLLTRRLSEMAFGKLTEEILRQRKQFLAIDTTQALESLRSELQLTGDKTAEQAMQELVSKVTPEMVRPMIKTLLTSGVRDKQQADRLSKVVVYLDTPVTPSLSPDSFAIWQMLGTVFRTSQGTLRVNIITTSLAGKYPELYETLTQWAGIYDDVDDLVCRLITYDMTADIYTLAEVLIKDIETEKNRLALLDYDDLIEKAVKLLTESHAAAWVLYKLDGGLDHILVDEAQDTSPDQWRVIEALAEEFYAGEGARELTRTIFAVGDEKQSIFSFQGADPTGFDNMRDHFKSRAEKFGQAFNAVPFETSYRSAPEILEFIDHVASRQDVRESLTAQSMTVSHSAYRKNVSGLIELWPFEKARRQDTGDLWLLPNEQTSASPREALAHKIATKISGWMKDPHSSIRARDVLILVQNRDAFVQDMIRALKDKKIPVAGADRMQLTAQIAVMDLLAIGEAVLLPEDNLSLAVFLRSPLGGLTEKQLFDLRQNPNENLLLDQLRAAVEQKARGAGAKNLTTAKAAYTLFCRLQADAEHLPPYEFYARLLGAYGGRNALVDRLGGEVDDPVNEFLSMALEYERQEAASLQGFLRWIQDSDVELKRDMEQGMDAVRIMTVHGAKGLEASIVFMPDTCRAPKKSALQKSPLVKRAQNQTLFWRAAKSALTDFGATHDSQEEARQAREHKRLLYVAMSRARDCLYIGGFIGDNRQQPPADSWYKILQDSIQTHKSAYGEQDGDEEETVWRLGDVDKCGRETDTDLEPEAESKVAELVLPDWLNRNAPKEQGYIDIESPSAAYMVLSKGDSARLPDLNNAQARQRGSLIHSLLEGLSMLPPETSEDEKLMRARAHLQTRTEGFDAKDSEAMLFEAMQVLDMPFMTIDESTDVRHELPVIGALNSQAGKKRYFAGRIDRYVETRDAIRLVDYKTNRIVPEDGQGIPPAYLAQMALYRALLQGSGVDKPISCWLVWTATTSVQEISATEMDDMVDRILKSP